MTKSIVTVIFTNVTVFITNVLNLTEPIDDENAHEKNYFYISAPDFTKDLMIGFSNGYTGPSDDKWEIIGVKLMFTTAWRILTRQKAAQVLN